MLAICIMMLELLVRPTKDIREQSSLCHSSSQCRRRRAGSPGPRGGPLVEGVVSGSGFPTV